MIDRNNISEIVAILREFVKSFDLPAVSFIMKKDKDPFLVLISTIISLRTKDSVTISASQRLFERASSPEDMLRLSEDEIKDLIFPSGFYITKAKRILEISRILVDKYNGVVPDEIDELLLLPGVGRKTANLVVTEGYKKLGICVDTHVHRISNRFGFVSTKTPEKTEFALRKKLPRKNWIEYNTILVAFGQNFCKPISPFCSKCPISKYCPRIGVNKSR